MNVKFEDLDDEKYFFDHINEPHFNKVQLICGTSGSGKTHFIDEFTRRSLRLFGDGPIPCIVRTTSLEELRLNIMNSLSQFLEIDYEKLDDYNSLLEALSIRIVFVIENISNLLDGDWEKVVEVIKDITRFDSFRFLITINEYEYIFLSINNCLLFSIGSKGNSLFIR